MSASTTEVAEVVSGSVSDLLKAYDLHHSGTESNESPQSEPSQQAPTPQESPVSWPSNRRRMPAYREPSRNHRLADRPAGETIGDLLFVTTMFVGVYVNSAASKLWRQTGGRLNDRIFRYEVGGER